MKARNSKGQFINTEPTMLDMYNLFLKYTDKAFDEANCSLWKGEKNRYGYGQCRIRRKGKKGIHRFAHRFAYEIYNNVELNKEQLVCHKCDNPLCVNPYHLFLGTNKTNSDDKVSKGRQSKGERHSEILKVVSAKGEAVSTAKLKTEDIPVIKELRNKGLKYKQIAAIYNVDPSCIYKIIKNKRWKHLLKETNNAVF